MCKAGLIVTDLDGTLLSKGSKLPEQNCRALREARQAGVQIAIASGRMARICSGFALHMGVPDCHILALNGAQIMDKPFGTVTTLRLIPDALRDACLAILRRENCLYNLYAPDGVLSNRDDDAETLARFQRYFSDSGYFCRAGRQADQQADETACVKFMVKDTRGRENYLRAREAIAALPGIDLTASGADNFEIMPQGVSKAQAVHDLALGLHVPMARVMALGDYDNDVELLKICGLSTAMGNGSDAAKAAARYVSVSNEEAGVAYAVRAMLRGEMQTLRRA